MIFISLSNTNYDTAPPRVQGVKGLPQGQNYGSLASLGLNPDLLINIPGPGLYNNVLLVLRALRFWSGLTEFIYKVYIQLL